MRWDYIPLDINPVFPGLGETIIIIIIIIIVVVINIIIININIIINIIIIPPGKVENSQVSNWSMW